MFLSAIRKFAPSPGGGVVYTIQQMMESTIPGRDLVDDAGPLAPGQLLLCRTNWTDMISSAIYIVSGRWIPAGTPMGPLSAHKNTGTGRIPGIVLGILLSSQLKSSTSVHVYDTSQEVGLQQRVATVLPSISQI